MSGAVKVHDPAGAAALTTARDEAFDEHGRPRPLYAELMATLGGADLESLRRHVSKHVRVRGVTFGSAGAFRVDPVPRLIDAAEWGEVERGLVQRVRALTSFVADVYGDRTIVASGRMPARAIESAGHFEPWMMGVRVTPDGWLAGLDLVRGADGKLRVLEDNMRTPSGLTYAVAARAALDAHLPLDPPEGRRDMAGAYELLHAALRRAAPEGVDEPRIALLSDGPSNAAWYEHRELARRLRIPIVHPRDLLVRGGRLHAWLEDARTQGVDVLYRRTDEDRLRDPAGRPTWLAELLLAPVRRGTLTVVNPFGAGVADDKLVHAYVEEMVGFYLGEEPILESVRTFDLGDPECLEEALDRLEELVIKPRSGFGGAGIVVCRHASADDRLAVARKIRERPEDWVGQDTVMLSTHPTVVDGRLVPRHVDLRPYVIGGGTHAEALAGGLTRVAFGKGALIVNSSQNGGGKDTWVIP